MTPARPVFAVGTGRCGTHFLNALFEANERALALHESNPLSEAFHRYCRWNALPVDEGGFIETKRGEIERARDAGKVFFEASGYLSLSIPSLFQAFRPRFVLITRNPVDTVASLWAKGWYEITYHKQNAHAPVGYHPVGAPHHFFSRLVPYGPEFAGWQAECRIGKLAWFWSTLHERILAQFAELPRESWTVVKLETLDFAAYRELAGFAGLPASLSRERFDSIAASRPGAIPATRRLQSWTASELEAFTGRVEATARLLGHPTDFAEQWRRARRPHEAAERERAE